MFGRSLFKATKGDIGIKQAYNTIAESKYLIDFYKVLGNGNSMDFTYIMTTESNSKSELSNSKYAKKDVKKEVVKEEKKITPKGVYDLQMLNDKSFKLKTDPIYVDGQLEGFKDKLNLMKSEEYDMGRGTKEIASIVSRLENRKKYSEVKDFFEEFPYTTTEKIDGLVKTHNHLKLGQVAQFLADMPKEAVEVMKNYNKMTDSLCKKQAVFYIIADKKDFEQTNKRRDPILLAQSPFGHFWQILGAWDEEMLFLGEL